MGAAVLLQCMGIVDIFLILPITHLIMFVNAAYTIGLIHYEAKQLGNELARKFRYPMYLIMLFFLIGTIDLLYPQIPADIYIPSAWDSVVYPYADLDSGIAVL